MLFEAKTNKQRTKDEETTNKRRTKDEETTNKRRRTVVQIWVLRGV